ncbi:MAG: hypothetical protein GEU94_11245, partial [Micromonosporaceae bacterium]|nr:hypothetical protein [Micromonosporaceae bacterium]
MVPDVWGDVDVSPLRADRKGALRVSEAFPRKPAPRHTAPTPEEIAAAREDFALHIPSLFTVDCLADGCDERWPCRRRRRA